MVGEAAQGGVTEQRLILVRMDEGSEGGVGMQGGGRREGRLEFAQSEGDLEEDIDAWVAGEGDDATEEFAASVGIEERFGEADGGGGGFWMRGIQGGEESFFVELSEAFECPEGVQLGEGMSG